MWATLRCTTRATTATRRTGCRARGLASSTTTRRTFCTTRTLTTTCRAALPPSRPSRSASCSRRYRGATSPPRARLSATRVTPPSTPTSACPARASSTPSPPRPKRVLTSISRPVRTPRTSPLTILLLTPCSSSPMTLPLSQPVSSLLTTLLLISSTPLMTPHPTPLTSSIPLRTPPISSTPPTTPPTRSTATHPASSSRLRSADSLQKYPWLSATRPPCWTAG